VSSEDIARIADAAARQLQQKQADDAARQAQEQKYNELKAQQDLDKRRYEQKLRDEKQTKAEQEKEDARKLQATVDKQRRHEQFEADRVNAKIEREKASQKAAQVKEAENQAQLAPYQDILKSKKSTLNQRLEARRNLEATQKKLGVVQQRQKITPATIKESIQKSVSKAPATIDRTFTGIFGNAINVTTRPTPQYNPKWYRKETQQMSSAVKLHAKMPVTGGKVTAAPQMQREAISVNQNYMDMLVGTQPVQKGKKQQSGGGIFGNLNNFIKRI
jgi:hypothetical protein